MNNARIQHDEGYYAWCIVNARSGDGGFVGTLRLKASRDTEGLEVVVFA